LHFPSNKDYKRKNRLFTDDQHLLFLTETIDSAKSSMFQCFIGIKYHHRLHRGCDHVRDIKNE